MDEGLLLGFERPQSLRVMTDISLPTTGADLLHAQAPPNLGAGVLVGIIDTGIDWTHEDFLTPASATRILRIWDQTLPADPASAGIPTLFGYGAMIPLLWSPLRCDRRAAWPSGKATDCKSVIPGSNPGAASSDAPCDRPRRRKR